MAIYRAGTASMNANGVITGVGTKWQDKLSLIRVGATMVFLTQPLTICTISAIVSDTELRATQTDGKVVPAGTNYVILLHDSITVDGLAQDVAETLRYYQSKETVIQDAIDFFQDFDFDKYKATADQVKADAAAAAASQVAAKTSETNAKTSETNAKASENAAAASRTAAAASQTAAKTSETNAKTSETNANSSKVAAAASRAAAKTSETNAKTSETNAKTSETNAGNSRTAAANSATAAAGSASAADGSKTAAATSAGQAAGSATAAAGSASAAAGSATTAKNEADRAKTEADRAATANPDNQLKKANNLSDVANKATSRSNLEVPGLNDASNTFAGSMVINNQNGITVKPGSGQANGWFVAANAAGVARYRLGIEANEQFKMYAYDSNGAGGRGFFTYEYASNEVTFTSTLSSTNTISSKAELRVETNSDSTSPSGSIVARRARANGAVIVTSETRANANGSIEWIKRDSNGTPKSVTITGDNYVQYNGIVPAPSALELGIKSGASPSYVDFHYDGSKGYDYSARIICDGMNSERNGGGNLRIHAGYLSLNGIYGGTGVIGERFRVATSDAIFDTQVGLSSGQIQVLNGVQSTGPNLSSNAPRFIFVGEDNGNDLARTANLNFSSWYGIGFGSTFNGANRPGKLSTVINTRNGYIYTDGQVVASGVTLTSDWNAKENVEIIDPLDALDKMEALDGWLFKYKKEKSDRRTAGALAQDVQLIIPDLVIVPEKQVIENEDGTTSEMEGDAELKVDYMGLIGYTMSAVKGAKLLINKQNEKLDAQQTEIDDLKSQIAEIKSMLKGSE